MTKILALALALAGVCPAVLAQASWESQTGFEAGLRYWLSTGRTQLSHNAQGLDPIFGNPTSILTYEDLQAHVLELHGRWTTAERWFIKGNVGLGVIRNGSFDDEDYLAGQVKFLDTTSSVTGKRLSYFSLDIGRDLWLTGGGRTTAGLFAGFQLWNEHADAFGVTVTHDPFGIAGGNLPDSLLVISNEVTWKSIRLGLATRTSLSKRTSIAMDLALVPYTTVRNEDSHHLRSDLGPVPNIIKTGTGWGAQADLELRHAVDENLELGVGVRHWWLKATRGTDVALGTAVPIVDLESTRTGVTFTVLRRW
ncbi:MAG TPA: hypothetical protein VET51_12035 [Burkholderiales bacterium]|nr:hypothetical protein [Burkholderiales bacterium]